MGSKLSCEKCEPATTGTVINLSDRCVDKLKGVDDPEARRREDVVAKTTDTEWMEKLKCIDESHSLAYKLTPDFFYALCARFDNMEIETSYTQKCRDRLVSCLQTNKNCMIKCYDDMKRYVECIDEQRIIKIKERRKTTEKQEDEEINKEILGILDSIFNKM